MFYGFLLLYYFPRNLTNQGHLFSEFSESLREMGECLLEKTAMNDDEESGEWKFHIFLVSTSLSRHFIVNLFFHEDTCFAGTKGMLHTDFELSNIIGSERINCIMQTLKSH